MSFTHFFITFSFALTIAFLAVLAVAQYQVWQARRQPSLFHDGDDDTVFLFDDEELLDATAAARALLSRQKGAGSDWQRFLHWAAPRFSGLEEMLDRLPGLGSADLDHGDLTLRAQWRAGLRHVSLLRRPPSEAEDRLPALARRAQEEEFTLLQDIMNDAPMPIWRLDGAGMVIWANEAYAALALGGAEAGGATLWPIPSLFPDPKPGRQALHRPQSEAPLWFDCHITRTDDGMRSVFAIPSNDLVQAERALGNFVTTLTKTFAYLPIGLAIFDQQRRLQLFNPALTDLTGLRVEFLSARPSLFGFLDAMREGAMIPEPRDYKSWRAQMAAIERSASDGSYEEIWTLPSGLTYRVTGRPHPEGALALLFEDISDEVTRARRMRADLELGQSVIDTSDEAIAVFSSSGLLVMSNTAYARLWGEDPSERPEAMSFATLSAGWKAACAPDPFWTEVEQQITTGGPRDLIEAQTRRNDGRALRCRVAPLAGGATLVGFRLTPAGGTMPVPRKARAETATG